MISVCVNPCVVEFRANRTDAAVHHVRRRDDVGSRGGADLCLPTQCRDGLVVEDVTVVVDDAVLSVRRVRIERRIGDDAQVRESPL